MGCASSSPASASDGKDTDTSKEFETAEYYNENAWPTEASGKSALTRGSSKSVRFSPDTQGGEDDEENSPAAETRTARGVDPDVDVSVDDSQADMVVRDDDDDGDAGGLDVDAIDDRVGDDGDENENQQGNGKEAADDASAGVNKEALVANLRATRSKREGESPAATPKTTPKTTTTKKKKKKTTKKKTPKRKHRRMQSGTIEDADASNALADVDALLERMESTMDEMDDSLASGEAAAPPVDPSAYVRNIFTGTHSSGAMDLLDNVFLPTPLSVPMDDSALGTRSSRRGSGGGAQKRALSVPRRRSDSAAGGKKRASLPDEFGEDGAGAQKKKKKKAPKYGSVKSSGYGTVSRKSRDIGIGRRSKPRRPLYGTGPRKKKKSSSRKSANMPVDAFFRPSSDIFDGADDDDDEEDDEEDEDESSTGFDESTAAAPGLRIVRAEDNERRQSKKKKAKKGKGFFAVEHESVELDVVKPEEVGAMEVFYAPHGGTKNPIRAVGTKRNVLPNLAKESPLVPLAESSDEEDEAGDDDDYDYDSHASKFRRQGGAGGGGGGGGKRASLTFAPGVKIKGRMEIIEPQKLREADDHTIERTTAEAHARRDQLVRQDSERRMQKLFRQDSKEPEDETIGSLRQTLMVVRQSQARSSSIRERLTRSAANTPLASEAGSEMGDAVRDDGNEEKSDRKTFDPKLGFGSGAGNGARHGDSSDENEERYRPQAGAQNIGKSAPVVRDDSALGTKKKRSTKKQGAKKGASGRKRTSGSRKADKEKLLKPRASVKKKARQSARR